MSKNDISRISQQPSTNIRRSKFGRSADYATTMNAGVLVPFYVDDGILPSDTFDISVSMLCRALSPMHHPVIDNAYLDVYFFGVPWRLVWEHAEEFHGATDKAWNVDAGTAIGEVDMDEYFIPTVTVPKGGYKLGSCADYMGVPCYVGEGDKLNVLPFRAYQKAYNDYFRDGNLMDEVFLNIGDNGDDDTNTMADPPYPVCKFHDLFTAALPYPQRGDPVALSEMSGLMPVFSMGYDYNPYYASGAKLDRVRFAVSNGGETTKVIHYKGEVLPAAIRGDSYGVWGLSVSANPSDGYVINTAGDNVAATDEFNFVTPINLYADASYAQNITINQLRLALQMQAILEADARGGTRYTSLIRQHFGVVSPDGRLQRAEYLGGKRISLTTQQVVQSSGVLAQGGDTLGSVGAFSKTVDSLRAFVKSFTEHTVIVGVMCIRVDQSYQQGLAKMWKKSTRFDYYMPELANIGEEPVKNHEIFWQGPEVLDGAGDIVDNQPFGYQEPWYDYRFRFSAKTGYLRSNARIITEAEKKNGIPGVVSVKNATNRELNAVDVYGNPLAGSLDSWHYAPWYKSLPMLNRDWIVEDPNVIDRTLAVSSNVSHQFLVQLWFNEVDTRPMPLYSIPGIGTHF